MTIGKLDYLINKTDLTKQEGLLGNPTKELIHEINNGRHQYYHQNNGDGFANQLLAGRPNHLGKLFFGGCDEVIPPLIRTDGFRLCIFGLNYVLSSHGGLSASQSI
jgi:hypothetical protein